MNETYKKLLLIVIGVLALLAAWFFGMKPNNEKAASVEAEVKRLTTYYTELLAKEVNRAQYLQDTEANYAMFEEKLDEFPSNLYQEYQLEFVQGVRNNEEIDYNVTAQGMTPETAFYVLGGSNAEGTLDAAVEGEAMEGEVTEDVSAGYQCFNSSMSFTYEGSYEGIKKFVNYVAAYPYRMTIDAVSVGLDEESGEYSGNMTVNIYCIKGNGREEQVDLDLDDIDTGVDNLFTGGTASGSVSKFAEDNGESIKSDYDLYIAVNPTSSDTSGKLVGLRSGGTNVTSDKNEAESVSISVSQEGDSYVVQYGIGTNRQRVEFDPGEDLTLLVQSSDIKDASDTNAIALALENSTDKTLYVKVVDDASANRIKVTNRSGSVIVYR
ncbi:MAG: hypothetical protein NC089_04255 [Bacteroides sp.]|nr:hypothetical protein [Bacteroides sp.]MCM1548606.1 hypothetical protein [Clostridium sp.]